MAHLGAVQADDAVHIAGAVVEVGDGDGMLAGGQPVLLGAGVYLEDVGPRAVDGLLPERHEEEVVDLLASQNQGLPHTPPGREPPLVRCRRGLGSPRQPEGQLAVLHGSAHTGGGGERREGSLSAVGLRSRCVFTLCVLAVHPC